METVVCIPTRRPPPVLTLMSYMPRADRRILVITDSSDLDLLHSHENHYRNFPNIRVVMGATGMGAQSAKCYEWAAKLHSKYFFRLDDDLPEKTFVHKDGHFPSIEEVIREAEKCLVELKVSLAGFVNSSNPFYLGNHEYRRTYGIIHGGANLSIPTYEPEKFIDPALLRCEDIYRTCAHRLWDLNHLGDGRNGRVQHIGIDKRKSTGKQGGNVSTISLTREQILAQRQIIKDRFPNFISILDDKKVRFRP